MSKTLTYKKKDYCLSFDGDTVFLDVEVEITRVHEARKEFTCVINKCQLHQPDEAFPVWTLQFMTPEGLRQVFEKLQGMFLEEIQPNLFSMFYSSDDNETTTQSD